MNPEQVNEELKETMREARGLLKDTRELIKNLIELNMYTRELIAREVDAEVAEEVKRHIDLMRQHQKELLDKACEVTLKKYDEFIGVLNGTDKQSRQRGQPSVEDLIRAYAVTNNTSVFSSVRKKKR